LQECLTNVARHSRASWVRIHLEQTEEATSLTVTDDGIGISDVQADGAASFGLQGIRERISALRGRVDVQGIPGEGTSVAITIPREAGTE
jgi:signal transduction histidine kinase